MTVNLGDGRWHFWIDRGGTFTDVVAKDPEGHLVARKLLSQNPERYPDAALEGIRECLSTRGGSDINPENIATIRMGTTLATNALLERKGAPTLLLTTQGFGDALRIGYQNRPEIFARQIEPPALLFQEVIEVCERIDVNGEVLIPLNATELLSMLQAARDRGLESVAIVFVHGYRFPVHELLASKIAKEAGFPHIAISHEVSPLIRFVSRGDTTVLDAYLTPVLRAYTNAFSDLTSGVELLFMRSNGGLSQPRFFTGKDAILSGPAGGVVAMAKTARDAGFNSVIGFDMGGTSTDISHYAGDFEHTHETRVAGIRMRIPMLKIETIASGGGSVLKFDGERCRVGPESAGAVPGPACYRRGGPLTLTDANLLLGKLHPDFFPRVFGPEGNAGVDTDIIHAAFREWGTRLGRQPEVLAEGFVEIAVQQMAKAIRKMTIGRGHDVRSYALNCFGGAGGQHACLVAEALGISRVFLHPLAGVLSAFGMGLADHNLMRVESLDLGLEKDWPEIERRVKVLQVEAKNALQEQIEGKPDLEVRVWLHLRYRDSDVSEMVQWGTLASMKDDFKRSYLFRHAFLPPEQPIIASVMAVEVLLPANVGVTVPIDESDAFPINCPITTRFYSGGRWHDAPIYSRSSLSRGTKISGPALLVEKNSTIVLEPGWVGQIDDAGNLILECLRVSQLRHHSDSVERDPIRLELFANLFMQIAEEMGLELESTASSVNIKERLDFSCAIFDGSGDLIANAPHMPVHLGSMGESVRAVKRAFVGHLSSGDAFVVNDPYLGGTHLPDVTVVSPVFLPGARQPVFFVASRGHHADIGGTTPGSMPPFSVRLEEEGICIPPSRLVSAGQFHEREIRELLTQGPYPSRNPEQNINDLRAQVSANQKGVLALLEASSRHGSKTLCDYMGYILDYAESRMRSVIKTLKEGHFVQRLDNGAVIRVSVRIEHDSGSCEIDFSGSSRALRNNFNCPRAVVRAAVLYVFRTLVRDDIPLNEGCLRPISVKIEGGSMLDPEFPSAVVAGNVETSTCLVNAIFGALGVMASSQPTMNNLSFGNDCHQYYETLAGGGGAGGVFDAGGDLIGGFSGASAVQTHMTNSRLTDPEVLELRYPVRVLSHAILRGTGGKGAWRGGDGALRRIAFLSPMTLSILSNGRSISAFGIRGGQSGAPGKNRLVRGDGTILECGHSAQLSVGPGDVFEIATPGGGGFGCFETGGEGGNNEQSTETSSFGALVQ